MSGMYWYAVAASDDVAGLKNKGFCVTSDGEILYNEQYEYALVRMYANDGHGIVDVETSSFFFDKDANDRITINAEDPMTTPVLSYKLRMTDQYPDAEWFYFAADKSEEILEDGVPHPLYKADGTLATKTDYADCEFEALNPMPSEDVGMYGRFTTATFSFATYQSTADVLHVEFTGLHQEEDEYCFADRLRVVVTASPAPALPTVITKNGTVGTESAQGTIATLANNASCYLWVYNSSSSSYELFAYDNISHIPCCARISDSSGLNTTRYGFAAEFTQTGNIKITNKTGSAYTNALGALCKICTSSSSTVITVYDSSNSPYNAFQYTSDGTDYYYVLDGTQTDWTDDLESIGYHVPPTIDELEIIVGIRWDPSNSEWLAKTFSGASDWWWCGILNQSDVFDLTELGVGIVTKSDVTAQWNGQIGAVEFNPNFDYSVEAMYSDLGHTQVTFNRDEFFIISKTSTDGNYDDSCLIHSLYATSTSVVAYKLKIKRGGNQNSCLYLQSDPLSMVESQWYPLYKMTGLPVEFTTQPSNVLGYFSAANEYDSLHLIPSGFTIEFRNNNNYLEVRQTNSLSQALSAAKIVVVWPSPAPALPTVSISGDFNDQNNKFSFENNHVNTTVFPNGTRVMYEWGTQQYKEYDTTKSYAVWSYSLLNGSLVGRTGFSVEPLTSGGKTIIQCLNSTSESITASYCFIAVCSSSSATVITVYDSSNNPYNAFQYTANGTDYYYVLDGTQTEWTDDLESIGYKLQQIYTAYFSDQGVSGSNVTFDGTSRLYDAGGNLLYYDSTKSYTLITGYLKNGTENNPSEWGATCYFREQDSSLHTLGLFVNQAFTFYKILYLVAPTA